MKKVSTSFHRKYKEYNCEFITGNEEVENAGIEHAIIKHG